MQNYQSARNVRRESRTVVGRFRGGKLAPVMAVPVKGNEGGMLSQKITLELDPIAGRMITPISGEFVAVFVPVQAIDVAKTPNAAYAGMTDVIREKLLSGNPLFVLEVENEISKRCAVNPRSIGGVKKVNEMVRLAHNAAVNYLRQRKYVKAALLPPSSDAVTPAIISQTVLERMNGVLDPDDRINGAVSLEIPTVRMPVLTDSAVANNSNQQIEATGSPGSTERTVQIFNSGSPMAANELYTLLNTTTAGNVSLVDFYNAERMDQLTRTMRKIVDENPEYGEEMLLRWAHGLSVDAGKVPFVIAEKQQFFGRSIVPAMDTAGVEAEVMRSDMMLELSFTVPLPRTELGGIVITFAVLKPDETLHSQPHPILSDVWGLDNFVADELALNPEPVTVRELDSDCTTGQESTVSMYVGHNALKQTYVHYGLARQLDPDTVERKTALWQLKIPMSVTPQTILYPADLDHYPFADQAAEVCTYTISSQAVIQTPMIFGPTPVEELAVIGDEDLFDTEE